jgi:hypothetical protein
VGTAGLEVTSGTLAVSSELVAASDITVAVTNAALVVNVSGKITTSGVVGSGAIILNNSTDGVTLTGVGTWTASGAAVRIAATGADAATIGASGATAATLTASGTAPTITVLAGSAAPNVLTVGADTTIALAGDGSAVGSIVLTGHATQFGKLSFANAGTSDVGSSLVTTGAISADNKVSVELTAPATGLNLVWYAVSDISSGGKWSKVGASDASNGLTGTTDPANVTLSGGTKITGS